MTIRVVIFPAFQTAGWLLYIVNLGAVSMWYSAMRGNEVSGIVTHVVCGLIAGERIADCCGGERRLNRIAINCLQMLRRIQQLDCAVPAFTAVFAAAGSKVVS